MKILLPAALLAAILGNHSSLASTPPSPPFVAGKIFINGVVRDVSSSHSSSSSSSSSSSTTTMSSDVKLADVYGCCAVASPASDEECPENYDDDIGASSIASATTMMRIKIGTMPQMTSEQSLEALRSAISAWDGGSGTWPQMSLSDRIEAIKRFMDILRPRREEIVVTLMYEIGKNRVDVSVVSLFRSSSVHHLPLLRYEWHHLTDATFSPPPPPTIGRGRVRQDDAIRRKDDTLHPK
jgi:hypothetical protein